MRLQHNIEPPTPGRGGHRKRKRTSASPSPSRSATPSFNGAAEEESAWRSIEPTDPDELELRDAELAFNRKNGDGHSNGRAHHPPRNGGHPSEIEDLTDQLPPQLRSRLDPVTRTIDGRSVEMVLYLVTKVCSSIIRKC